MTKKMKIARIDETTVCSVMALAGTLFLFTRPIWCGRRFSIPDTKSRRPNEKKVRFAGRPKPAFPTRSVRKGFQPVENDVAEGCPFRSHTTPEKPIRKITAAYTQNCTFT